MKRVASVRVLFAETDVTPRPKSKAKAPEQWEATVTRMIGKGAKLSDEEKKTLVDYLGKTYKP